ncbi:hypothetical protein OH77DRAFT_914660 [Trametes cingulata]|nr:hypothetical protein OH77DRAFT_914660 [Trametes cingulata]
MQLWSVVGRSWFKHGRLRDWRVTVRDSFAPASRRVLSVINSTSPSVLVDSQTTIWVASRNLAERRHITRCIHNKYTTLVHGMQESDSSRSTERKRTRARARESNRLQARSARQGDRKTKPYFVVSVAEDERRSEATTDTRGWGHAERAVRVRTYVSGEGAGRGGKHMEGIPGPAEGAGGACPPSRAAAQISRTQRLRTSRATGRAEATMGGGIREQ